MNKDKKEVKKEVIHLFGKKTFGTEGRASARILR